MLLNIVALRYGDAPLFLEVTSVISQYTREGSLNASVRIDPGPGVDQKAGVGGNILLRETPTVTYTPLAGDRFARSLLAPIAPASLLGMMESGWAPDLLFRIAARSINGVGNGSRDPLFAQPANPEFEKVLVVLARLRLDNALVLHIDHGEGGRFTASARLLPTATASDLADLDYLRRILRIPGDGRELAITFSDAQTRPDRLAIGTRSMFEIFSEMAQGVDVPQDDGHRAMPGPAGVNFGAPLLHIASGRQKPADAHVAIRYRGRWFWIDGSDVESKRIFLIAQILFSLNDTGDNATAPLVTIPTG